MVWLVNYTEDDIITVWIERRDMIFQQSTKHKASLHFRVPIPDSDQVLFFGMAEAASNIPTWLISNLLQLIMSGEAVGDKLELQTV